MNFMGTLAKVALAAMVARGVGKMINKGGSASPETTAGGPGGLGGMLGGLGGSAGGQPSSTAPSSGGLGGLGGLGALGGLLGGLGGALGGSAGQGSAQGTPPGGLGGMLGSVLSGGAGSSGGGLGGLLDSLGGAGQSGQGGGLGGLLNQALGGQAIPEPSADQNHQAEIMLRAMINAAKCDGQIDENEKQKIIEHLGDVTAQEIDFVRREMSQPLDVQAFVRSVPRGMEQQVYLMSLLGIDLDSQAEAQYLDQLAQGLGLSPQQANEIHAKVGVPLLYT